MRAGVVIAILAGALSVSCGTFRNFYNDTDRELPHRAPYGGVRIDVLLGVDMYDDERCGSGRWPACILQRTVVGPYLLTIDLAASAIADTVTLPATR
jgi:uncharacterized protein YceK